MIQQFSDTLTWDDASCKGLTEIFFSDDTADAVSLCHTCPIEDMCRTYALRNPHLTEFGVWGGLTEKTRRMLYSGRVRVRCPRCTSININRQQPLAHVCANCGLSWKIAKSRRGASPS